MEALEEPYSRDLGLAGVLVEGRPEDCTSAVGRTPSLVGSVAGPSSRRGTKIGRWHPYSCLYILLLGAERARKLRYSPKPL